MELITFTLQITTRKEDMDITWYISLSITNLEMSRDAVCNNCPLLGGDIKHLLKGLNIA